MIEQFVDVDRMEHTLELFGSFDENIRILEQEYHVDIINRGTQVKVSGEPEGVAAAQRAIRSLLELLNKITSGNGEPEDIDKIEELSHFIQENSLCGLGQTAPNPVLSTLRYFRDEYMEHINNKHCPAGVCKDLLQYTIDPAKCKGCTLCARTCPVGAITGTVKEPHAIDPAKCIKCGACMEKCRFGAISKG